MGLWAWTLSQIITPKFWKLVKKEGFLRTYIRPHQTSRHSHYAGGYSGAIKMVGQDQFGNKYFEDWEVTHRYQRRWVEYSEYYLHLGKTGDALPPKWHGWMSHVYDDPPSENHFTKPHYQLPHTLNTSGTPLHHKPQGSPQNLNRMEFIEILKNRRAEQWVPPKGANKLEGKKIVVEKQPIYEDVMARTD